MNFKLKEIFRDYFVVLIAAFFYGLLVFHAENSIFNDWVPSDPSDQFPIIHLDLEERLQKTSTPLTEISDWFWSEKDKNAHVRNLKLVNLGLFIFSCVLFSALRRKRYEKNWEFDYFFILNPLFVWLLTLSTSHGFFLGIVFVLLYEYLKITKDRGQLFPLLSLLPGLCSSHLILFPLMSYFAENQNKLINKKFILSLVLAIILLVWSLLQNQNQVFYYGQLILAESFIEAETSFITMLAFLASTIFKALVPLALRYDYFSLGIGDITSIFLSIAIIYFIVNKSKENLKWISVVVFIVLINFIVQTQIVKENLLVLSNGALVFWRPLNNLFLASVLITLFILPFDIKAINKKYSVGFASLMSFLFLINIATHSNSGQVLSTSLRQNPKSDLDLIALKQYIFEKDNDQDLILFQKEMNWWNQNAEKKFITTLISRVYDPENEFKKEMITSILESANQLNYSIHPYIYADLISASGRFDLRSKFYEQLKQDKRISSEVQQFLIATLESQYKDKVAGWLSEVGRLASFEKKYEECLLFLTISQGMLTEEKQKQNQETVEKCKKEILKKGKK